MNLKMNLDMKNINKKTLIQVVVLVLILVLGAGLFFRMQSGEGLDFLTGLLGAKPEAKAPPPPPPVARRPAPPKPAEPAIPAELAIPTEPAKGRIEGRTFALDASALEEGVLTLRQGKDKPELELSFTLPGNKWETPAGKSFKFEKAAAPDAPRLVVSRWEEGREAPVKQEYLENYRLVLEFGQEKDKRLPGKISLTLPDAEKSAVAGTFEAEIRGFRIINGQPDLASDSVDTLEFLALKEILKDDPDKPIGNVVLRDGRYVIPADAARPKTGYLEAVYQVGDGQPLVRRFQFVKDRDIWRLLRTLSAAQIDEAHPHEIPDAEGPPERFIVYLAAKRLEAAVAKKQPGKGIYGQEFSARFSDKRKIGVCEVSYRSGPEEPVVKASYLFRLKKGGWALERELKQNERVNLDKGVVLGAAPARSPAGKQKPRR